MKECSKTYKKLKKLIKEFNSIEEDGVGGIGGGAPTNTVGSGAIAGVGVKSSDPKAPSNFSEPGVLPKTKKVPKNPQKSPVMSNFRRSPPKF